jgi:hypothetical protein
MSPMPVPLGFPMVTNGSNNVSRTEAGITWAIVQHRDVEPLFDSDKEAWADLYTSHPKMDARLYVLFVSHLSDGLRKVDGRGLADLMAQARDMPGCGHP